MALIIIRNMNNREVIATDITRPLLFHFQQNYIDWMHACGGKGRCTTCKCRILNGLENLEPDTPAEERYRLKGDLKENERLSCQAKAFGDIEISVPEESKLPHVNYSDL